MIQNDPHAVIATTFSFDCDDKSNKKPLLLVSPEKLETQKGQRNNLTTCQNC